MKRRYQVRWYNFNLTEPMSRDFFTEIAATIFYLWLKYVRKEKPIIYESED
jgi:hypothetical protein